MKQRANQRPPRQPYNTRLSTSTSPDQVIRPSTENSSKSRQIIGSTVPSLSHRQLDRISQLETRIAIQNKMDFINSMYNRPDAKLTHPQSAHTPTKGVRSSSSRKAQSKKRTKTVRDQAQQTCIASESLQDFQKIEQAIEREPASIVIPSHKQSKSKKHTNASKNCARLHNGQARIQPDIAQHELDSEEEANSVYHTSSRISTLKKKSKKGINDRTTQGNPLWNHKANVSTENEEEEELPYTSDMISTQKKPFRSPSPSNDTRTTTKGDKHHLQSHKCLQKFNRIPAQVPKTLRESQLDNMQTEVAPNRESVGDNQFYSAWTERAMRPSTKRSQEKDYIQANRERLKLTAYRLTKNYDKTLKSLDIEIKPILQSLHKQANKVPRTFRDIKRAPVSSKELPASSSLSTYRSSTRTKGEDSVSWNDHPTENNIETMYETFTDRANDMKCYHAGKTIYFQRIYR